MSRLICNLSVGTRIAILCLIPILAALAIGLVLSKKEYEAAGRAESVADAVRLAPRISGLVHELQKERGISAGFVGSKGEKFATELAGVRGGTDRALADFGAAMAKPGRHRAIDGFVRASGDAEKSLARLDTIRRGVSSLSLSGPDSAAYYTGVIAELLTLIESVADVSSDGETARALAGWIALLQGKERAGQERAAGTSGFSAGSFAAQTHRSFVRLAAQQDTLFGQFRSHASAAALAVWDGALSAPIRTEIDRLRLVAWDGPFGGDVKSVPAQTWFDVATRRIDALKAVEDRVADEIVAAVDDQAATARLRFWVIAGFLAVLAAATGAISYHVARTISVPIGRLSGVMHRLADDDVTVTIEDHHRRDEIGDMARAVEVLRESVVARLRLEQDAVAERERAHNRQMHVDRLVTEFRSTVGTTLAALGGETEVMRTTAGTLTEVARAASTEAASARAASSGASENVQTVAAASEELAASIREIAAQTQKAGDIVGRAAEAAVTTDNDVSSLAEAAEKIGAVVELIRNIAGQTNLLALNATIEAARAGDMGRGFAVVASEVKALAHQTSVATTEIAAQIAGIQTSTRNTVDAIRSITHAIGEISSLTTTIASAVEEQEGATREIAQSVQCASDGTTRVARNVASVDEAILATSTEAGRVRTASDTLARAAAEISRAVEGFLHDVADDGRERLAA